MPQAASPRRLIAIDWSGAATAAGQRQHIWCAEWTAPEDPPQPSSLGRAHTAAPAVTLRSRRTRAELTAHLIRTAEANPSLVVGMDFSFSFPAWFTRQLGVRSAPELWPLAGTRGEAWLQSCQPPFWGRTRRPRPPDHLAPHHLGFRTTELQATALTGRLPSSTFQIGGAGSVGTGSIRGMPHLLTLRQAGFSVWPFDPPRLPLVVEIYPRLLTGPVRKSSAGARTQHLNHPTFAEVPEAILQAARSSEDAFDALCSVLAMAAARHTFVHLPAAPSSDAALEGAIWAPSTADPHC